MLHVPEALDPINPTIYGCVQVDHVPAYKHFDYSHGNNITTMTIICSATAIITHRRDMGSVVIELKLVLYIQSSYK